MFGNLVKVCGVTDRLSKTMQNELMNIVTIFLGITVGATASAENFLRPTRIEKFTFFRRKKHHAELLMELENFLGNIVRGYEISKQKLALWETVKSSKPKK